MAFFKKLFEKKECSICGGEIGLLGNRKLEDGNCCKECAGKLSPWFDDRRHSTVEQIQLQLEAREKNREELRTWDHNMVFGEHQKIYFRFAGRIPDSFVISSSSDYKAANADIIPLRNVTSCDLDIQERHRELKRQNSEGEEVSYNPPRYEYSYDFYINLMVTGFGYIDDMRMRLNRSTLELETTRGHAGRGLLFSQAFDPMHYPEYREYKALGDTICQIISCGQRGVAYQEQDAGYMAGSSHEPVRPKAEPRMRAGTVVNPAPAAAAVASAGWNCPSCGSSNTGKFCSSCGSPKPAPRVSNSWTCFCGTVNTAKFCQECGTERFRPDQIWCSECSWTTEDEDDPNVVPKFCPNCGKEFNGDDVR